MPRIVRFYENGAPEVLKIEDVEVPPPGPGEIALEVKALGLNRAESMFRLGHYVEEPVFPARLGYEAGGSERSRRRRDERRGWRRGQYHSAVIDHALGCIR
jgi:hypothetical protein